MKVLVTGATGFVGSHVTRQLLDAGHEVRLLVRDRSKAERVLAGLGVVPGDVELVGGDVTDAPAVRAALGGCSGVISAASLYSLRPADAAELERVNVGSARLVLGTAAELGLDPIVHTSSISALVGARASRAGGRTAGEMPGSTAGAVAAGRRGDIAGNTDAAAGRSAEVGHPGPGPGPVIDEKAPVGDPPGAYARSKAGADRVARELQERGAPVVITYPTMILGPHDPTMGDAMANVVHMARGLIVVQPRGGVDVVDVRDVAAGHVAALVPGRGPRRYLLAGHHVDGRRLTEMVARLAGRPRRVVSVPGTPVVAAFRMAERVLARLPQRLRVELPTSSDGLELLMADPVVDAGLTRSELGLHPRPLEVTLTDTLDWMVAQGILRRGRRPARG